MKALASDVLSKRASYTLLPYTTKDRPVTVRPGLHVHARTRTNMRGTVTQWECEGLPAILALTEVKPFR